MKVEGRKQSDHRRVLGVARTRGGRKVGVPNVGDLEFVTGEHFPSRRCGSGYCTRGFSAFRSDARLTTGRVEVTSGRVRKQGRLQVVRALEANHTKSNSYGKAYPMSVYNEAEGVSLYRGTRDKSATPPRVDVHPQTHLVDF